MKKNRRPKPLTLCNAVGEDIGARRLPGVFHRLFHDLMYGASAQPFLQWASAHGALPRDGLGMLVEQAAESFLLWRGVRPDTAPVLAALRARMAAPR